MILKFVSQANGEVLLLSDIKSMRTYNPARVADYDVWDQAGPAVATSLMRTHRMLLESPLSDLEDTIPHHLLDQRLNKGNPLERLGSVVCVEYADGTFESVLSDAMLYVLSDSGRTTDKLDLGGWALFGTEGHTPDDDWLPEELLRPLSD